MRKIILVIIIIVSATILFQVTEETYTMDELSLQNVEALAAGEGRGKVMCLGTGSVDCRGYKVQKTYSSYTLDRDKK